VSVTSQFDSFLSFRNLQAGVPSLIENQFVTTGTVLKPEKIPPEFRSEMIQLCNTFDVFLADLVRATTQPIFQLSEDEWKRLNFPFLHDPATQTDLIYWTSLISIVILKQHHRRILHQGNFNMRNR
jgi:hypothetical protein